MSLNNIIVVLVGFAGIIFVYWFFLMKKENAVEVENAVTIKVEGGYSPSTISIPKNKTTTITFTRTDPSTCLEEVVMPDFKIRKFLPLNTPVNISITPKTSGTFEIVCGMNMFHGKIIVK